MERFPFGGKCLREDRRAAIEGLPLQLMILVIIAGLATTVIVGWMGSIDVPNGISTVTVEPGHVLLGEGENGVRYAEGVSLEVAVYDRMGDPVSGAAVVLSGCSVSDGNGSAVYALTGSDGIARFSSLSMQTTGSMGEIDVTVSKSGYGSNSEARVLLI